MGRDSASGRRDMRSSALGETMSGMQVRRYVVAAIVFAASASACVQLASPALSSAAPRARTPASSSASMGMTATETVGEVSPGALWAVVGPGEIISEDGGAHWRSITADGVPDYFDDLTGVTPKMGCSVASVGLADAYTRFRLLRHVIPLT